ncbi:helix-turn-helix domain-containing protein [Vibrio splendidus]
MQQRQEGLKIPLKVRELSKDKDSALKAWLNYLGISQCDLAKKLNVSQARVSQYCSERINKRSVLLKISDALGITPEQLDFEPDSIPLIVFINDTNE